MDGKYADAVLGDFNGHERPIVAVEGKGTKDPLDRPFAGRKLSAVQQGYPYAINLTCDWIIVTSMRQTRLYFKGADTPATHLGRPRSSAPNPFASLHFSCARRPTDYPTWPPCLASELRHTEQNLAS